MFFPINFSLFFYFFTESSFIIRRNIDTILIVCGNIVTIKSLERYFQFGGNLRGVCGLSSN
jgi:hypothetical protein